MADDFIKLIPYKRAGDTPREAAIIKVDFETDGLSENELMIIEYLSKAISCMTKIFRDQFCKDTKRLILFIKEILEIEYVKELEDYLYMLNLQSSPFDKIQKMNVMLSLHESKFLDIIEKSDEKEKLQKELHDLRKYFYTEIKCSDYAEFYPHDMTDVEFESLGENKNTINSRVVRIDNGLDIELHENNYSKFLDEAISHLAKASDLTTGNLKKYIDAKIQELKTGSKEDRINSDIAMIQNDSDITFILSTALEVYLDARYNIRGSATGNVMVTDRKWDDMMQKLIDLMPRLEASAPWKLKKAKIDNLPKINFVNVFTQSGDYINAPAQTVAQSLPNEQSIKDRYGTVNFVYSNITDALTSSAGLKAAKDFIADSVLERFGEKFDKLFRESSKLHHATHELGHTTGALDSSLEGKDKGEILGKGLYSSFEECRAELFSLFCLPYLYEEGIISQDQCEIGYHDMVLGLVVNCRNDPTQAHVTARNMMFHKFLEDGAIIEDKTSGKAKYCADIEKMKESVKEMLGEIGNIKTHGRTDLAEEFSKKYAYPDCRKADVEERTKHLPLGRGLIYPELYDGELKYVGYLEQRMFR